jgi:hypothetical protein
MKLIKGGQGPVWAVASLIIIPGNNCENNENLSQNSSWVSVPMKIVLV